MQITRYFPGVFKAGDVNVLQPAPVGRGLRPPGTLSLASLMKFPGARRDVSMSLGVVPGL